MQTMKIVWIIICALLGAAGGAIILGGISSLLTLPGAVVGLVIGGLLGKYIPFWEWFA